MKKLLLTAALAAAACIGNANAQVYPSRPITVIVPFPAGGATDTLARILAEPMRASLGQPIVIENVGGAAGSIGVGRAVRAPADGYTLSIGTSTTHVLIGALYALQFDLLKDLEPVAQIAAEPLLIAVKKTLPANDLEGLIAWLKANPDKASAGIAGVGATGHVSGISFQKQTGTRFQFVPYRGNGPAIAGPRRRSDRPDDRAGVQFPGASARRHDQGHRRDRQAPPRGGAGDSDGR